MTTLHTVNKTPFERAAMANCLARLADGDSVLIFEDGVVGARKGSAFAKALQAKMPTCEVFVLGPDAAARGISSEDLIEGVQVVDYGGFVDLAARCKRVCAWL